MPGKGKRYADEQIITSSELIKAPWHGISGLCRGRHSIAHYGLLVSSRNNCTQKCGEANEAGESEPPREEDR